MCILSGLFREMILYQTQKITSFSGVKACSNRCYFLRLVLLRIMIQKKMARTKSVLAGPKALKDFFKNRLLMLGVLDFKRLKVSSNLTIALSSVFERFCAYKFNTANCAQRTVWGFFPCGVESIMHNGAH